jgi:membrane-associated phospholipid phosphatase
VLASLDHRLLLLARTRGHTPGRDRAVAVFSKTGEHAACWLALGFAGTIADTERRSQWLAATATVAASYAFNTALKFAVGRPRPQLPELPPLTSTVTALSFPSAHATTSFAAAGVYRAMIPAAPSYALASLFAVSRPYLGVHYPSDVLAGALLGSTLAAATHRIGVSGCR